MTIALTVVDHGDKVTVGPVLSRYIVSVKFPVALPPASANCIYTVAVPLLMGSVHPVLLVSGAHPLRLVPLLENLIWRGVQVSVPVIFVSHTPVLLVELAPVLIAKDHPVGGVLSMITVLLDHELFPAGSIAVHEYP